MSQYNRKIVNTRKPGLCTAPHPFPFKKEKRKDVTFFQQEGFSKVVSATFEIGLTASNGVTNFSLPNLIGRICGLVVDDNRLGVRGPGGARRGRPAGGVAAAGRGPTLTTMGRTSGAKNKPAGSPRSPKAGEAGSAHRRLRIPELATMSLTPYPLSLSTEMVMAMNAEAGTIQDKLKSVSKSLSEIEAERKRCDPNLEAINSLHDKIQQEGKLTPVNKARLKSLYVTARGDAEREADLIRSALSSIYEIRSIRNELRLQAKHSGNKETIRRGALMKMLQNTAQTLPLWIGFPGEEPPALCGAVQAESNYVAKAGDMVAALDRSGDGEENWILAEVISYNPSSNKYEVEDIDEEQRERMILSRRRVIPLPTMRANPDIQPEALFQEGVVVNAIYPQTTCFYKGVVKSPPATAVDDYEILFEDPSYTDGFAPPLRVAQRYVIVYKEKRARRSEAGRGTWGGGEREAGGQE